MGSSEIYSKRVLEQTTKKAYGLIQRLSPVAWWHINSVGKYEFCSDKNMINLQALTDFVLAHSKINVALESRAE